MTLAGGHGCDEPGAVCTRDGQALQNTVTAKVGALRIITYSALSFEGEQMNIEMLVTLSRPLGVGRRGELCGDRHRCGPGAARARRRARLCAVRDRDVQTQLRGGASP